MTEAKAAGPKTELVGVSQRMQQSIEDMVASLSHGVGDCMEAARKAPASDYDTSRMSERRDAVQFVSATAELLQSIAKLKGEFRQSYHVTRVSEAAGQAPAAPRSGPYWNGDEAELLSRGEYDALSEKEQVDYDRWIDGLPPRFGGWKRPRIDTPKPPKRDELAELGEEVARVERLVTTPLPESRGSNANAGKS